MTKQEEIIEKLKFTVAMCEYDPLTGDIIERCFMNDMTRTTYDGCKAAIEFIEKHQYVHDKCKKCIEFSEFKQQPCEDAISREAVEKITWEEPSYDDALNVLTEVRDKVRALPSVKPEIKWIPVSEKLPNSYEYVLATMISPVTQLPFVSKLYTGENAKEKIEEAKVIAWMALPKPYKEKK